MRETQVWLDAVPIAPTVPLPLPTQALLLIAQTQLDRGDHARAFLFFEKAARSGHSVAFNMLGRAYERGWGCRRDPCRARNYFDRAARGGDGWAMFNLADLYLSGEGGSADPRFAHCLYVAAARRGVGKALNMLGVMAEHGVIAPADTRDALTYYKGGAKAGDGWAAVNAARLHLSVGDHDAARAYLVTAQDAGPEEVQHQVAKLYQRLWRGHCR